MFYSYRLSAANLIEFTKNGSIGRYGFLLNQLIL